VIIIASPALQEKRQFIKTGAAALFNIHSKLLQIKIKLIPGLRLTNKLPPSMLIAVIPSAPVLKSARGLTPLFSLDENISA
jgi:hypothetical protein